MKTDLASLSPEQDTLVWLGHSSWYMHPAETAQASADLNAKAVVPGHNGRFVLAKHTWNDPLIQLAKASKDKNYRLLTPELGEPVRVSDTTQQFREWWE